MNQNSALGSTGQQEAKMRAQNIVAAIRRILGGIRGSAVLAACAVPTIASAQLRHPNLSGTWIMNAAKSKLEVPAPDSTIFIIRDTEPTVRIFRTHARGEKLDTATIVLRTDSSRVDWALHGTKLTGRSWWDHNELVFWTGFADPNQPGSQVVRYSLSADKRTFTAVERVDTPTVKHVNRWVFDRRE